MLVVHSLFRRFHSLYHGKSLLTSITSADSAFDPTPCVKLYADSLSIQHNHKHKFHPARLDKVNASQHLHHSLRCPSASTCVLSKKYRGMKLPSFPRASSPAGYDMQNSETSDRAVLLGGLFPDVAHLGRCLTLAHNSCVTCCVGTVRPSSSLCLKGVS